MARAKGVPASELLQRASCVAIRCACMFAIACKCVKWRVYLLLAIFFLSACRISSS